MRQPQLMSQPEIPQPPAVNAITRNKDLLANLYERMAEVERDVVTKIANENAKEKKGGQP